MSPIIKRVPDFEDGKTFIIENVLVDHCSVFQPNTTYRPEWAVVIRVPQQLVQQFYEVGFRLKQNADGIVQLRAKRWVRLDDGTEMKPPQVVDADGNPWDVQARGLIGNGSRCNVKVRAKYTTYQGVEGLGCFLEGLQVCDLVPYAGSGPGFSKTQGNTAGWSQQNFQPQPPQHPAPPAAGTFNPNQPGQYPAQTPAQQGFVPPGYPPQPNPAPGYHPPQQPAAPVHPAVPLHMQQTGQTPVNPFFGTPSAPPPQPGALTGGMVGGGQPPYQEEEGQDYTPYTGTGKDTPF